MRLTSKKVEKYITQRTNQELRHCPNCIAAACNDASRRFSHDNAKDFMRLLCFNDPILELMTHNYGFHTANGRNIIETIKEYYYKYENLEL